MTTEQLRRVHQAKPFRPFEVHVADGRAIRVDHPELLTFSPPGRTFRVFDGSNSEEVIDLLLVTSLKTLASNGSNRNGRSEE
jgi:hypothetical protein